MEEYLMQGSLPFNLTGGPSGIAVTADAVAVELLGNEDDGITGFTSLADYLEELTPGEVKVTEDIKMGEEVAVIAESDLTATASLIIGIIEENEEVAAAALNDLDARVTTLESAPSDECVKVINLDDYSNGEIIPNVPFISAVSLFGNEYMVSSHYRDVAAMRVDCFMHDTSEMAGFKQNGLIYAIMQKTEEGLVLLGYLIHGASFEGRVVGLYNTSWEVVDKFEDTSAEELAEMVIPLFGEDLHERLSYLEHNLPAIGDLNDLTTTDKSSIVSAINEIKTNAGNGGGNANIVSVSYEEYTAMKEAGTLSETTLYLITQSDTSEETTD